MAIRNSGGAFEETLKVRSSKSLSSKIFVVGQSFIVIRCSEP